MRWMLMTVALLALPLRAGQSERFQAAVTAWADDDVHVRKAASREVRAMLERELAPLLAAMHAEDPEVARRAREALASLLPPGARAPGAAGAESAGMPRFVGLGGGNGQVVVFVNRANPRWNAAKLMKELHAFGIKRGYPCTSALLRKQLGLAAGRGYIVDQVDGVAEQIGFQQHDVLLAIDGVPVMAPDQIKKAIGARGSWKDRTYRVMREGRVVKLAPER